MCAQVALVQYAYLGAWAWLPVRRVFVLAAGVRGAGKGG